MPTLAEQIDLLRTTGDQFPPADREASWEQLPGITMTVDGEPALYDARILPQIPTVVAPSSRGIPAKPPRESTASTSSRETGGV